MSVIPYCIYYNNGICRVVPALLKDKEVWCRPNISDPKSKWEIGGMFYAINPEVKPIPRGMQLYAFHLKTSFPYNVYSVDYQYDPFNLSPHSTHMIAYNIHVPNTIPLYIYKNRSNDFYVSFKPMKMQHEKYYISKIYVFPEYYDKFECIQGSCIPDHKAKLSLKDCIGKCVKEFRKPLPMLSDVPIHLSQLVAQSREVSTATWVLRIVLILLIAAIIILIIYKK